MKDTNITFESLKEKLNYFPESSLKKIEDAYFYAKKEHEGEKRLTGDDFITHPLHVAEI